MSSPKDLYGGNQKGDVSTCKYLYGLAHVWVRVLPKTLYGGARGGARGIAVLPKTSTGTQFVLPKISSFCQSSSFGEYQTRTRMNSSPFGTQPMDLLWVNGLGVEKTAAHSCSYLILADRSAFAERTALWPNELLFRRGLWCGEYEVETVFAIHPAGC